MNTTKRLVLLFTLVFSLVSLVVPSRSSLAQSPYRAVDATGSMYIVDDENWPESDETGLFYLNAESKWVNHVEIPFYAVSHCVGGEVRVELHVRVRTEGQNLRVTGHADLYEGTSCSTNDLETSQGIDIVVPPTQNADGTAHWSNEYLIQLRDGAGRADIKLRFANWIPR